MFARVTVYENVDLEMADRHSAEGERHIARQEQIVTEFRLSGYPMEDANELLRHFNETLASHRTHRDAIAAALEDARRGGTLPLGYTRG